VLLALAAVWLSRDGAAADASAEREQHLRRSLSLLALSLGHPYTDTLTVEEMHKIAQASDRPMAADTQP
jgi:hypothetical protein